MQKHIGAFRVANVHYEHFAEVADKVGAEYRRVAVEVTIHNAFQKDYPEIASYKENVYDSHSVDVVEAIGNDGVLVVSHRGDWRNAPENSLQAIQNCIEMGVDMVEIDLKRTKDGHLVLMHDKTIDRTTTGKGRPEDYTLKELKEFYLRGGAGHKTRHKIPTFEEVMLLCKGKIMVNVDKGYEYFKEAYAILEETGTVNQCIIKSD